MSKKGGSRHYVRMRASKSVGVVQRKKVKWLLAPAPGTHKKAESVSAGVLLRDVLSIASSMHEVKRILMSGNFIVDGKKVKDVKFPVGLMDIVSLPAEKKSYRMVLTGVRLTPKEISGEAAGKKYLRVVGKHTVKAGKTALAFHDGRNYLGDVHMRTGDTCIFSVPEFKLLSHMKLEPGATCLIMKGKHTGEIAKLEKLIERPGSHDTEALLSAPGGEFITVAKYLFIIDKDYA